MYWCILPVLQCVWKKKELENIYILSLRLYYASQVISSDLGEWLYEYTWLTLLVTSEFSASHIILHMYNHSRHKYRLSVKEKIAVPYLKVIDYYWLPWVSLKSIINEIHTFHSRLSHSWSKFLKGIYFCKPCRRCCTLGVSDLGQPILALLWLLLRAWEACRLSMWSVIYDVF